MAEETIEFEHGSSGLVITNGTEKQKVSQSVRASVVRKSAVGNPLVVVRYFLDRPGYGLQNSAARLWFDVPAIAKTADITTFLKRQGIALDDLLVELYIDKFGSYMLVDACEEADIEWDFSSTTNKDPGFLLVRLTDTSAGSTQALISGQEQSLNAHPIVPTAAAVATPKVNASPIGLFAFSMVLAINNATTLMKLQPGSVGTSFTLTFGPYALWIGGFLQLLTGIFELLRNNIFGGVAFTCFGAFWLANGTISILHTFFSGGQPADEEYTGADRWGRFILEFYVIAFVFVLLKQTFVINKLTTLVLVSLICNQFVGLFISWSDVFIYLGLFFGFLTSFLGFYLFTVEFTNIVYNREVIPIYKWSEDNSPDETFGAPGKSTNTLLSKAAQLRLGVIHHGNHS